ncbi:MAG: hypothetical protein JO107_12585, partial [Hyphomicrobiales bacterium]|nr:hypothetical protein [Hyphomicrobiales bacterium]
MTKANFCALLLAAIVLAMPARAQTAPPAADSPPPASGSALSPADAARALDVLNDPAKHAQLIDTLRAVAKAAPPKPAPPPSAAPSHLSLQPNGLSAQFVVLATRWAKDASAELVAAAGG